LRYAQHRDEAKEFLQEGFIRIFNSLHQFQFKGSLEGWTRRIMVNACLQNLRSQSPVKNLFSIEQIQHPETSEEVNAALNSKELIQLIQQLPSQCRLVFNLYVFDGYKHKEIAKLLNISENTSKSHLHDARRLLQHAIEKNSHEKKIAV
jgi:RNA polymerase sigma-70 factor (ECF subfamily)